MLRSIMRFSIFAVLILVMSCNGDTTVAPGNESLGEATSPSAFIVSGQVAMAMEVTGEIADAIVEMREITATEQRPNYQFAAELIPLGDSWILLHANIPTLIVTLNGASGETESKVSSRSPRIRWSLGT